MVFFPLKEQVIWLCLRLSFMSNGIDTNINILKNASCPMECI